MAREGEFARQTERDVRKDVVGIILHPTAISLEHRAIPCRSRNSHEQKNMNIVKSRKAPHPPPMLLCGALVAPLPQSRLRTQLRQLTRRLSLDELRQILPVVLFRREEGTARPQAEVANDNTDSSVAYPPAYTLC